MKALSVKPPWSDLILLGHKTVELRSRRTSFRGEFVLCSSARPSKGGLELHPGYPMPLGVTLAICELVDVAPATEHYEESACCVPEWGDVAWLVRVVRRLKQLPVKGRLGFWEINPRLVRPIR